ncbi:MAG: MEDS domain-containing protein [Methylococcaceae bacterium]|nr:MEDS domain-containing protein [Methylococcaceae bacterium]
MNMATDSELHDLIGAIEKIGVHDHLCLIYETQEEQFSAVIPFMKIGLDRGEKCIYIADDNTAAMVIAQMKTAGIDVAAGVDSGRLAIVSKQEAYLKQGYFDPDWMIDFLNRATDQAKAEGYSALRVTGEMTWVLGGDPGTERLMEYEAKLNYFFPDHDALAICQYNRNRFSPEVIKDVIFTHPLVICGGLVCRNFYYVPPDDFLAGEQPAKEIDRILANIINREKVEESLRASEERMRLFFERQLVGMAITSPEKGWIQVNDKICEMLGYPRDELLRLNWAEMTYPDDLAADVAAFERLLRGEIDTYMLEKRFVHKDGRLVFTNLAVGCVRRADRSVDYVLALMEDITERKRAEENIQELNKELLLALNAAEAANKAKSLFLANMSHELRTPLNAILGFSNLLRRDPHLTQNQRDNLDIISRSGNHLLNLINDVLEMAKIETGRVQLEIAPFDLDNMVREVGDIMRLRAKGKGLLLLLEQSPELPRYIKGDEARLRQILVNLISNAVKFTTQGGIAIRLGVGQNARHHLLIEVEDSGPGIAPQDQRRLFDPFVQLAEAGTQHGTGLGLAITRQFVQLMGGSISVDSTPGKGSLFRVELPLTLASATDVLKPANGEHGKIVGIAGEHPVYRILIAEDQPDNQLLLFRLMTDIGLDAKVAENGEQCVKIFQDWRPDLIWMDRRMPVMDGVEASRRIRCLPDGQTVKIVAVTASVFKDQQQEMLDAGMNDFIRKPYRLDEIYECLARQLDLKYRYQSDFQAENAASVKLTVEMLGELPAALRQELRYTLESLDGERIAQAIRQVGKINAPLGLALSRLADNFDYPSILAALDSTGVE